MYGITPTKLFIQGFFHFPATQSRTDSTVARNSRFSIHSFHNLTQLHGGQPLNWGQLKQQRNKIAVNACYVDEFCDYYKLNIKQY
jgi:hypothetical protein